MQTTKGWTACATRLGQCATLIVGLILLGSCSRSVTVNGVVPTPLVNKIPITIGIVMTDAFRLHRHEEKLPRGGGQWQIETGAQQTRFFQSLFTTMFAETTVVDAANCAEVSATDNVTRNCPAGFLQIDLLEFAFLTPQLSGLNFFSTSKKYQLTLTGQSGQVIDSWIFVGYGKSDGGAFQAGEALNNASVEALRDAGARIAVGWSKRPAIRSWLMAGGVESDE